MPVLGIEPAANVAEVAIDKDIATLVEFFGRGSPSSSSPKARAADLIVGNNVLAQVPDLNDFVAGMAHLLKPEGVITLEFPHLQRLIEREPVRHDLPRALLVLLARHDRATRRARPRSCSTSRSCRRTADRCASILRIAQSTHREPGPRVAALLARERRVGFDDLATYASFAEQVKTTKRQLLVFLIEAKDEGKSICGYGAPGKGNTLLNYCGIGTDFLDFTVDRNPYKHGRFTPGTCTSRSCPSKRSTSAKPDYVLILPWNLKDEIVRRCATSATGAASSSCRSPKSPSSIPRSSGQ